MSEEEKPPAIESPPPEVKPRYSRIRTVRRFGPPEPPPRKKHDININSLQNLKKEDKFSLLVKEKKPRGDITGMKLESKAKNRPPIEIKPEIIEADKKRACRPIEWTDELIEMERLAFEQWIATSDNYVISGFLAERNLTFDIYSDFCKRSVAFRQTAQRVRYIQECRLVKKAMQDKTSAGFIKFMLQAKFDWKERQEISGDSQSPLAVVMAKIAAKGKDEQD